MLVAAVGTAAYGVAAQYVHFHFDQAGRQEYLGWGEMWLAMSFLFVVIPALIVDGTTFRCRFDHSNPWLGSKGRMFLIAAAIIGLTMGAICGWPK